MSDPEDIVDVDLSYELPSIFKSVKESWLASSKTAAIVTALLAVLSVQLFVFMKDEKNFSQDTSRTTRTFLQVLSYSAVVFNASATFTSPILVVRVGELTIRASMKRAKLPRTRTTRETSLPILKFFGMDQTWIWVMCHWLFSLLIGVCCILLEILVYISMQGSETSQITVAFIIALAILLLMLVASPYIGDKLEFAQCKWRAKHLRFPSWGGHSIGQIIKLLKYFFEHRILPWFEVLNLIGYVSRGVYYLYGVRVWLVDIGSRGATLLAVIEDVKTFVQEFFCSIKASTSRIYCPELSLSPKSSPVPALGKEPLGSVGGRPYHPPTVGNDVILAGPGGTAMLPMGQPVREDIIGSQKPLQSRPRLRRKQVDKDFTLL